MNQSLSLKVLESNKNSWYEGTWEIIGKVGEWDQSIFLYQTSVKSILMRDSEYDSREA